LLDGFGLCQIRREHGAIASRARTATEAKAGMR
jgi:hypothetical protein